MRIYFHHYPRIVQILISHSLLLLQQEGPQNLLDTRVYYGKLATTGATSLEYRPIIFHQGGAAAREKSSSWLAKFHGCADRGLQNGVRRTNDCSTNLFRHSRCGVTFVRTYHMILNVRRCIWTYCYVWKHVETRSMYFTVNVTVARPHSCWLARMSRDTAALLHFATNNNGSCTTHTGRISRRLSRAS